jgi:DHA1 family tetracycline resistance protein-like MFS transporter
LMCRRVRPSEQGQLQGAIGSIRGISGMLGPGLFTLTFATFIGPLRNWNLPGSSFLLSSILLLAALLTVSSLKQETRNS